jgi:hypothetical protein
MIRKRKNGKAPHRVPPSARRRCCLFKPVRKLTVETTRFELAFCTTCGLSPRNQRARNRKSADAHFVSAKEVSEQGKGWGEQFSTYLKRYHKGRKSVNRHLHLFSTNFCRVTFSIPSSAPESFPLSCFLTVTTAGLEAKRMSVVRSFPTLVKMMRKADIRLSPMTLNSAPMLPT